MIIDFIVFVLLIIFMTLWIVYEIQKISNGGSK
jgi:hypothetical protein